MGSPKSEGVGMGERAFAKQRARSGTQATPTTMLRGQGGLTQQKLVAFSAQCTQYKDTHKSQAPQQDGMVDHGGPKTGEMTGSHHIQEGCRQQLSARPEGEHERQNQDPREGQWRETQREEHIV